MRAVEISRFGGPEVLTTVEVPEPELDDHGVKIAVTAVEVLFVDTQLRSGWAADYFPMRPPWIPGTGVAGTVVDVGAQVDPGLLGADVVARTGDEAAYAERVVVPAGAVARIPAGLDPAVATAALHDGPLALDRLDAVRLGPGSRVLVTAAAGSLGHWFVPLAKATGAYVVGAAGGDGKVTVVRELGADAAVDYRRPGWPAEISGPFDVVFDGTGGAIGSAALSLVAEGGTFFGHGAASGQFATSSPPRDVTIIGVERKLDDAALTRLTARALALLADGVVRPTIGQRVPLERAANAHAAIAARTVIGKTVLTL